MRILVTKASDWEYEKVINVTKATFYDWLKTQGKVIVDWNVEWRNKNRDYPVSVSVTIYDSWVE